MRRVKVRARAHARLQAENEPAKAVFIAEKRVETLSSARNPTRARRWFFLFAVHARITLDFPFLFFISFRALVLLSPPPFLLALLLPLFTVFSTSSSLSHLARCTSPRLYLRVFGRVRVSSSCRNRALARALILPARKESSR